MKAKRVPDEPIIGDIARWELAWLLGDCTEETLNRYSDLGILIPTGRKGVWNGDATIRAFARYHMDVFRRKRGPMPDGQDAGATRHALAQANLRIAEVRLATEEGKLISFADVQDAWTTVINMIRAGIMAIPGRCALELPHWEEQPHDRAVVEREINDLLTGLADTPPKVQA